MGWMPAKGVLGIVAGLGPAPIGPGREHRPWQRRGVLLALPRPPRLELLRPPADGCPRRGVWPMDSRRIAVDRGLRLGFVLFFAGSTLLVARLAGRAYGNRAEVPAALALNASWYFGAAAGTFVLPDGPLLFFWLLTIDRLMVAIGPEASTGSAAKSRVGPWLLVGLAWGGAMLSKYHAIFLPMAMLAFVLVDPKARHCLRTPGPYLASVVGLILFTPVIYWNAQHDWHSFTFQGARASGSIRPNPAAMAGAIVAQAGYLLPWMAVSLGFVAVRILRRPDPDLDRRRWERFFLTFSVVPFGFFLVVSLIKPVLPHWGLIGAVSLMPALGASWAGGLQRRPQRLRLRLAMIAAAPVLITGLAVLQANLGWLPIEGDPSRDLDGWDQIADELRDRGLLDEPGTFVFTGHWHVSGQLAQAIGPGVPVLCYHEGDSRGFADWSRPEDWVGQDGILVAIDDRSTEPACFDRWFERIVPICHFQLVEVARTFAPFESFDAKGRPGPSGSMPRRADSFQTLEHQ